MKISKNILLAIIGGFLYYIIEILYKGTSHVAIFFISGICFVLIGLLNCKKIKISFISQMFISSIIITTIEFISGYILNICFGLNIWSYYHIPYNILGQICLPFSILWFFLSAPAILLNNWLRYVIWGEEKPYYKWL